MKIILVGAHGTGKTTLAGMLNKELGYPVVESASRDIKKLMDSGKINITDKDYHELITAINVKLWRDTDIASRETHFIYTRTIIDNLAYSGEDLSIDALHNSELYNNLKNVDGRDAFREALIIRIPIEFGLEDDGVRYTDRDYQKSISDRQEQVLDALLYDYSIVTDNIVEVHGSPKERLKQAVEAIYECLYSVEL